MTALAAGAGSGNTIKNKTYAYISGGSSVTTTSGGTVKLTATDTSVITTIAGGLAAAGFAVLVAINPGRETPPRPALQDANKVLEKKSSITPQDRTVDDGLRQRSDSEAQAQELATKAAAAAALAATSPTVPANRADPAPIPAVAPGTNLAYVNTAVAPVAPTTNEVRPNLFQAGAATDASKVESFDFGRGSSGNVFSGEIGRAHV